MQFHFRTCIEFAPHSQLTSNKCGAFPHTMQAIVPLSAVARENCRINSLSIVPHSQLELFILIANFNLDLLCLGVPKGIP